MLRKEVVAFKLDEKGKKESILQRVAGKSVISFIRSSVCKSPDASKDLRKTLSLTPSLRSRPASGRADRDGMAEGTGHPYTHVARTRQETPQGTEG